jgi:hypothetical protein
MLAPAPPWRPSALASQKRAATIKDIGPALASPRYTYIILLRYDVLVPDISYTNLDAYFSGRVAASSLRRLAPCSSEADVNRRSEEQQHGIESH